ncbi:MAG: hypothetical protein H7203_12765 [Rhizobacter sp.]|nr:hypothetical protein [Burkholderiales bacterium]
MTSTVRRYGWPSPSPIIPFAPKTTRSPFAAKTTHGPSAPKAAHTASMPTTTQNPFALSAAKGLTRHPSNPSPPAQGERESASTVCRYGWPSPSPINPVRAEGDAQPVHVKDRPQPLRVKGSTHRVHADDHT